MKIDRSSDDKMDRFCSSTDGPARPLRKKKAESAFFGETPFSDKIIREKDVVKGRDVGISFNVEEAN